MKANETIQLNRSAGDTDALSLTLCWDDETATPVSDSAVVTLYLHYDSGTSGIVGVSQNLGDGVFVFPASSLDATQSIVPVHVAVADPDLVTFARGRILFVSDYDAQRFKGRFPEFSEVPDITVDLALIEANNEVGENWLERDRKLGQNLLAAHRLSMENEPERSRTLVSGGNINNGQTGTISSMRVGDVSLSYAGRNTISAAKSGLGALACEYQKTSYGQRYYELLCKNLPALRAI